jgi:hypothetical protein
MNDREQIRDDDESFDLERAPLDRPSGFDTDWGGDGSDLTRPVRAHVLAALPPSSGPYPPPLDALATLGDEDVDDFVTDRGIGQEHVPELVRMVRDRALVTAPADAPANWAPFHALELLSELDCSAHVADLITLFDTDRSELTDELLWKLGGVGGAAVAPLVAYMNDRTRWDGGRSYAANALEEIGNQLPDTREAVVAAISALVENGASEREGLMGIFVSALIGLKAVETLPIIRRAFEHGWVDETVSGSWGTVLDELGATPDPNDPLVEESRRRFEERHARMFPHAPFGRAPATPSQRPAPTQKPRSDQARKEKNKRKAAKASRKANRKKRK